jgi:hypothetical protein
VVPDGAYTIRISYAGVTPAAERPLHGIGDLNGDEWRHPRVEIFGPFASLQTTHFRSATIQIHFSSEPHCRSSRRFANATPVSCDLHLSDLQNGEQL